MHLYGSSVSKSWQNEEDPARKIEHSCPVLRISFLGSKAQFTIASKSLRTQKKSAAGPCACQPGIIEAV